MFWDKENSAFDVPMERVTAQMNTLWRFEIKEKGVYFDYPRVLIRIKDEECTICSLALNDKTKFNVGKIGRPGMLQCNLEELFRILGA